MSPPSIHGLIRQNPKFTELVSKRTRLALVLTVAVLLPYYTFMLLTSLHPDWFATKIAEGSVITIGWPIAALIVVGSWLLTGVYVAKANGEFDSLNEEILKEVRQ